MNRQPALGPGMVPMLCKLDCLVPANRLREIGIAHFEFMGEFVPANVIFGRDDAGPILGMIPLQSVGIEVDPRTGRLKRRPSVRLKMAR